MFEFLRRKKNKINNVTIIVDEGFYPKAKNPYLEDIKSEWNGESLLEMTKYSQFIENKPKFYKFYNEIRDHYRKVKPSDRLHKELLEIFKNYNLTIINLGMDQCFEKLKFKNVIHPKGINTHLICNPSTFGCGRKFRFKEFNQKTVCVNCKSKEHLKPNIDWFKENSDTEEWNKAKIACETSDLIIFIGKDCQRMIVQTLISLNTECKKVEIAKQSSDILETEFHYVILADDNIIGVKKLKSLLPIYLKG